MGRIRDNNDYIQLTIDQVEHAKLLRKMANVSLSEMSKIMSCSSHKIYKVEHDMGKVDSEFYHNLIKKYETIIKYKDK